MLAPCDPYLERQRDNNYMGLPPDEFGGREWKGQMWVFAECARRRRKARARKSRLTHLLSGFARAMAAVFPMLGRYAETSHINGADKEPDTAAAQAAWPALELLTEAAAPQRPCEIEIVDGAGICPRGWQIGGRLEIDSNGRMSAPLCRTAMDALNPLLLAASEEGDFEPRVSCRCPLPLRHLTFAVRPARQVGELAVR